MMGWFRDWREYRRTRRALISLANDAATSTFVPYTKEAVAWAAILELDRKWKERRSDRS